MAKYFLFYSMSGAHLGSRYLTKTYPGKKSIHSKFVRNKSSNLIIDRFIFIALLFRDHFLCKFIGQLIIYAKMREISPRAQAQKHPVTINKCVKRNLFFFFFFCSQFQHSFSWPCSSFALGQRTFISQLRPFSFG